LLTSSSLPGLLRRWGSHRVHQRVARPKACCPVQAEVAGLGRDMAAQRVAAERDAAEAAAAADRRVADQRVRSRVTLRCWPVPCGLVGPCLQGRHVPLHLHVTARVQNGN